MWQLLDKTLQSRFILGTALYPSLEIMLQAIAAAKADLITVSLKRSMPGGKDNRFWQKILASGCHILPNTAGCRRVDEAVNMAAMAREIFETDWIKLEVIGDDYTLQPDTYALVTAAEILINKGFKVLPYCTDDLIIAQRLVELGCKVLMPWAAPIGSGKGLINPYALKLLRSRLPQIQLIIDAGIGLPSEAAAAMEMGFDGVLLNSAVALAGDPTMMAEGFKASIEAGRLAYMAQPMPKRDLASPSTALIETPFWQQQQNNKAMI